MACTAEQSPAESYSFTSSGVGLSSDVLHSVGDGDSESLCHQGSSSSGISSLASAFRDIANTQPSGALRRNRSFPRRKPSLSRRVGSSSDCCSLDRLEYSTGSMERVSSLPSFPTAKAPSHTSSLGSVSPMSGEEKQKRAEPLTCIRSHTKGSLHSDQHQRRISSDQLRRLRDEDITIEERKALMQQKALEKAQKVKVDAKVACWVACMKRSKPGKPAPGIELVDRMNLSHLNAKTLPKGKGWKTRGLLEMVEGIVSLVCKLPRGTESTCLCALTSGHQLICCVPRITVHACAFCCACSTILMLICRKCAKQAFKFLFWVNFSDFPDCADCSHVHFASAVSLGKPNTRRRHRPCSACRV